MTTPTTETPIAIYPVATAATLAYREDEDTFGTFLDDVRISTNVRLFGTDPSNPRDPASRAIGTRVSQTVRDAVLGRGNTWLDRAFVVDDWYVSAYHPLSDGAGQRGLDLASQLVGVVAGVVPHVDLNECAYLVGQRSLHVDLCRPAYLLPCHIGCRRPSWGFVGVATRA